MDTGDGAAAATGRGWGGAPRRLDGPGSRRPANPADLVTELRTIADRTAERGPGSREKRARAGAPRRDPRRPARAPGTPARPARGTGGTSSPGRRPGTLVRRLRLAVAVASVLVLAVTGTAWGLYRDLTAGITTTDVIGGGDGGDLNILLVGVDSRTDARGNPLPPEVLRELNSGADTGVLNSDTIMLLHVPEGGGAASAFSIPRDVYVDIPGHRPDKINAAYPVTKARVAQDLVAEGVRDPAWIDAEAAQAGRTALIEAVEALTGLTVDHYAEINLLGFYDLTRAVGGVEVCLTGPVDEPLSGARFAAGPQTISGRDALAFVRQRHGLPEGDLSRIRRQQVFLAAVADKILSAGTLTDPAALGVLVGVAQRSLVIDAGWDVLAFAQQASDIAAGNLEFVTIPTRGPATNARGDVLLVDRFEVREFVERRIAEQAAAAEAAQQAAQRAADRPPAPGPVDVIASRYVTNVLNGSTRAGLAAGVAEHLAGLGFLRGTVDNTDPAAESVVRYTGADGDAASAVAEQLGAIATESVDDVPAGHLMVVLGDDFDPTVLPAPAPTPDPAPAPAPPPGDTAPITAAGVPCID